MNCSLLIVSTARYFSWANRMLAWQSWLILMKSLPFPTRLGSTLNNFLFGLRPWSYESRKTSYNCWLNIWKHLTTHSSSIFMNKFANTRRRSQIIIRSAVLNPWICNFGWGATICSSEWKASSCNWINTKWKISSIQKANWEEILVFGC